MKKFLFLIALFTLMGGVNSYATKKYASFANATQTWTSGTNTFSWNSTSNNFIATGLPTGDISSYTNFHCTVSDFSENANFIRLVIKNGKDPQITEFIGAGEFNVDFVTKYPTFDFTCVTDILIFGSNSATAEHVIDGENLASVVITDCYMEKPFVFAFDATGTAVVDVTDLKAWGCLSINHQTGVVTNSYEEPSNKDGYLKIDFSPAVDMSNVYGFKVNYTGDNILDGISVNDWRYKYGNNIYGRNDIAASMAGETSIEAWIWGARNTTGSLTISSVEFYSNVITANPGEESLMTDLTAYHWNGSAWQTSGHTPSYRVNESTNVAYYGVDWNGEQCQNYSDVEGYKAIRIYSAQGNTPRAMFFKSDASGQQQFDFTWNAEGGYYELLLSTVYASVGNYKLISVRPQSGTTSSIKGIYIIENSPIYDYKISGNGLVTSKVTEALADATATSYDATGVTGTGVDFTSVANPNALFKANAGVLANTKNVIVDGTCDNLELTDGYPFKAPIDFTATAASYSTTINAEAGAGTLCLPFAAIPDGVTAYTLTYTSGDKAAATPVETTIPANTPVLLNGSGAAEFTGSGAVSASATNVQGALTGVFEATTVPVNSYVLQNGDRGLGFYKVETDDIVANPFRAYLTAQVLGARSISITYGGVTGINDVKAKKVGEKDVYYNLNGQRVSNPTKGVFIKNGVKVSF